GYLARAGHEVVGVDLDPHLIAVARAGHPQVRWEAQNLAGLDLRDADGARLLFDLQVSAGNVPTLLAGAERRPALSRLADHPAAAVGRAGRPRGALAAAARRRAPAAAGEPRGRAARRPARAAGAACDRPAGRHRGR